MKARHVFEEHLYFDRLRGEWKKPLNKISTTPPTLLRVVRASTRTHMKSQRAWTKKRQEPIGSWKRPRLMEFHATRIKSFTTTIWNSRIWGFSVQESLTNCKFHNGVDACTPHIHKACHSTTLPAIPEEGRVTKQHDRQQPTICRFLRKASQAATMNNS